MYAHTRHTLDRWGTSEIHNLTKILHLLIIAFQIGVTFAILVLIYMIFALLDYEGGFDRILGLAVFQPIVAIILSSLTIIFCFLLGLPIRIVSAINVWWTKHFYLAIVLVLLGIVFLILSITPHFMTQASITTGGEQVIKSIPHGPLVILGWFLTGFSILHCYPPYWLYVKVKNVLTNGTGSN